MSYETIIEKLHAVRKASKSATNRLLLADCILELNAMRGVELEKEAKRKEFYVRQRVKFDEDAVKRFTGQGLTEEGRAMRFLVNTVDEEKQAIWVVDEKGVEKPRWVSTILLIVAED